MGEYGLEASSREVRPAGRTAAIFEDSGAHLFFWMLDVYFSKMGCEPSWAVAYRVTFFQQYATPRPKIGVYAILPFFKWTAGQVGR